jgi:two-component system sensor histidine kinase ChvG
VRRLRHELGRIRVRLLVVTLFVVLVPVAGLEFARLYERQLLGALERDMRNQAVIVRAMLVEHLDRGAALDASRLQRVLERAAARTRMRVRVLDERGSQIADSHAHGPPEGPEPPPPALLATSVEPRTLGHRGAVSQGRWPDVPDRREVRDALAGKPSAYTRVRERHPEVLLFVTEPVWHAGDVVGVVYVTRSTQPVLVELHRIRAGLLQVLAIALGFTLLVTLVLAWSISRPLGRLSRAAKRIAGGEQDVVVPVDGSGEIRELGESLAAMTDELRDRARYVSELAADVAHEFKSPLTSIRGAAELLSEGADDDPDARRRFLRNIELDADRLDRLVSRLLELSRIEASTDAMTVLDLERLLRRVAEAERTAETEIRVRYDAETRLVRGRERDLETAFRNVIENAVRYSPPSTPVDVVVRGEGDRIAIEVSDRGPGIPDAHLERVFDRFFTTDEARNGTGLGLAIARSVATAHGGDVKASSSDGATITVRLPVRT